MPLKSLVRGRAILKSRSKKLHIFSPRKVTCTPTISPSLDLKEAMDCLAPLLIGRWPVIFPNLSMTISIFFLSLREPTPELTTTFTIFGDCIMFFSLSVSFKSLNASFTFSFINFMLFVPFPLSCCKRGVRGELFYLFNIRNMHRRGLFYDLAFLVAFFRLFMHFLFIDTFYQNLIGFRKSSNDRTGFALIFARNHYDF